MSVLEVRSLSIMRSGRKILDRATLRVAAGEFVAVIGPNGSGKSTLLRALTGLWKPLAGQGTALLNERPLASLPRQEIARQIAFVPQEALAEFAFTVAEIVAMGRYPHRSRFARESSQDRAAVETAMRQCDVLHLKSRPVDALSGGERQRVLLARCLAAEPAFIVLDEPTASLDVEHALGILELCRHLSKRGRAVVLATHDLNAVARYAQRIVLVHESRLDTIGSRDDVLFPSALRRTFGVETEVTRTTNGEPFYVFRPASAASHHPSEL